MLVVLLGLYACDRPDREPPPPDAATCATCCNGSDALCEKRFDQAAYATAHNAMSSADDGWLAPNQTHDVPTALTDGIRGLMLDTWYDDTHDGEAALCHGICAAGSQPLVEGLSEITAFLEENPREVVTLILEAYVSEADTATAFEESGLIALVHAQDPDEPWPTLGQMIDRDERLVVLTSDASVQLPWHHHVWDHAFDNPYAAETPEDLSCDPSRGSPDNPLFIYNHFLTHPVALPELAEQVNHDPFLTHRVETCADVNGRDPSFVTVDFYDIGDVLSVVAHLNATD